MGAREYGPMSERNPGKFAGALHQSNPGLLKMPE